MRFKLGYVLPILLIATPALAQNWSYKPAPGEWYVPAPNAHNGTETMPATMPAAAVDTPAPAPAKKKSNPIFGRKTMTETKKETTNDVSDWEMSKSVSAPKAANNTEFSQDAAKIDNKTEIRSASEMAQTSPKLQAAVSCAAALQIAALAAPEWSSETGVAQATNLWLEKVFTEADSAGVPGDKVNDLVKTEMDKQTNAAVTDPQSLNTRAFDCATNMPS